MYHSDGGCICQWNPATHVCTLEASLCYLIWYWRCLCLSPPLHSFSFHLSRPPTHFRRNWRKYLTFLFADSLVLFKSGRENYPKMFFLGGGGRELKFRVPRTNPCLIWTRFCLIPFGGILQDLGCSAARKKLLCGFQNMFIRLTRVRSGDFVDWLFRPRATV